MGALIFFSFLAAVIIVPQVLKSMDRRRMYETMRAAYERGQPVPPEMVDAMTRRARMDPAEVMEAVDPSYGINRDLRRGVILVAVGVGVLLIGVALYAGLYNVGGSVETLASCAAGGAVPFCIGLAYLGLWWFGRRKLRA
jgi:hypothetical protein